MKNGSVIGYLTLCLCLCLHLPSSFSQELLSSAGDVYENQYIQLEWSLGETIIETISQESVCFTQGFHQPLAMEPARYRMPIKVMPNPFDRFLTIELPGLTDETLYACLFDISGRLVFILRDLKENNLINTYDLYEGVYMLNIYENTSGIIFSDKIVKYQQP